VPVSKDMKPPKPLIDGSRVDELFSALTRGHRRRVKAQSIPNERNPVTEVVGLNSRVSGPVVVGSRRERVYVPSSVLPKRSTVFSAGLGGIRL
jgi:hypothetical protein